MLNTDEIIDTVANIVGTIGRALVFVGMTLFCALVWYLIIQTI